MMRLLQFLKAYCHNINTSWAAICTNENWDEDCNFFAKVIFDVNWFLTLSNVPQYVSWHETWHRSRKKYLIYMRVGTMMMRWKNENFPLGVALDKWPSKTCAMRILQGLRELSVVEELKWDLRKEESLCKPACDSVITIVTNWYSWWRSGRDTSGGWIMFTKTPEQGRTRGKERQIQHNNLQIAETPRHGAFLYIWCIAFSPLLAPCPSGHKLCDYRLWTPGPGQRKDVWDGQCCETSAQSVMQVWDKWLVKHC